MNFLRAVDNTYAAFYKQLKKEYNILVLRRWVLRHSSGKVLTPEQEKEIKAFFKPKLSPILIANIMLIPGKIEIRA